MEQSATWTAVAWLAPILWATFLTKALLWKRFFSMPVWVCYSVMAIPFDFAWALYDVKWTLPYMIPALIMRIAVTVEAVFHILRAVRDDEGHRYAVMSALWVGCAAALAVLLHYDPRGLVPWLTGAVRMGCAFSMVIALGSWAGHRLKSVPFCWWHAAFMTAWLTSTAIAGSLGKHRGDAWDTFAIIVRDVTLLGWIWLIGDRMLDRDLASPAVAR